MGSVYSHCGGEQFLPPQCDSDPEKCVCVNGTPTNSHGLVSPSNQSAVRKNGKGASKYGVWQTGVMDAWHLSVFDFLPIRERYPISRYIFS
jgi:hypothetical protein